MSDTLEKVKSLVALRNVRLSDHGFEGLRARGISLKEIIDGVANAQLVEEYPFAFKGPSVLTLQTSGPRAIHVVWGLSKYEPEIVTLITAYVPCLEKWYDGFKQRRVT
jgi:hypothetical protein